MAVVVLVGLKARFTRATGKVKVLADLTQHSVLVVRDQCQSFPRVSRRWHEAPLPAFGVHVNNAHGASISVVEHEHGGELIAAPQSSP
jgi:hypothetical protein